MPQETIWQRFALARYTPDGKLDPEFGLSGRQTIAFPTSTFQVASCVAIDNADRVVVGGRAHPTTYPNGHFAVARCKPDGELDEQFNPGINGGGGLKAFEFEGSTESAVNAVTVDGDGKIVLAGYATLSGRPTFALARLDSDGNFDTSFSSPSDPGRVTTNFTLHSSTPLQSSARSVAIDAEGKIVVSGIAVSPDGTSMIALAHYNSDGTVDTSFPGSGKILIKIPDVFAPTMTLDAAGNILLAGTKGSNSTSVFALGRRNPDGSPDTSFSSPNNFRTAIVDELAFSQAECLVADPAGDVNGANDTVIVAGAAGTTSAQMRFALARFRSNGTLENSFAKDGTTTTHFPKCSTGRVNGVTIDGGGKIVAAGYVTTAASVRTKFALARYLPDGSLDKEDFTTSGRQTTAFDDGTDAYAEALAIDSKENIVLAGWIAEKIRIVT